MGRSVSPPRESAPPRVGAWGRMAHNYSYATLELLHMSSGGSPSQASLRELMLEALNRTGLDREAAAKQVAMRLDRQRPEDAQANKELEDKLFFDLGIAALYKLWEVDRRAALDLAR